MPTRRRSAVTSWARIFWLSIRISPSSRELRTVSCMRFKVRSKVDLPHPEGPINEVTLFEAMFRLMSNSTCLGP